MNDNKKFCCDTMDFHLTTESEELVEYEPMNREYSLIVAKSAYGTHQPIVFCPWCGYKLPKSLSSEWESTLLKECGISQKILDDYGIESYAEKLIPPEFKTDEWWKKRGLQQFSNGKLYKDAEQKLNNKKIWWTKDIDQHGRSINKLYKQVDKGLEWIADVGEEGKIILDKHKSTESKLIKWKELIKVK